MKRVLELTTEIGKDLVVTINTEIRLTDTNKRPDCASISLTWDEWQMLVGEVEAFAHAREEMEAT